MAGTSEEIRQREEAWTLFFDKYKSLAPLHEVCKGLNTTPQALARIGDKLYATLEKRLPDIDPIVLGNLVDALLQFQAPNSGGGGPSSGAGIVPQGKFKSATAKSNEGVNIHSQTAVVTLRQPTIQTMLKLLWKWRILFVKGPPFSGKSSLASFSSQFLEKDPKINTAFVSFGPAPDDFDFSNFWEAESGKTWDETLLAVANRQTVLILDEVQVTYVLGKKSPLWKLVKNVLNAKYPHIALLMFGAYGGGLQEFDPLATPVQIPDEYVMLLTPQDNRPGLLATEVEFNELVDKHERKYKFNIGAEPKEYIKHITSRHLGLVKYILKFIKRNVANQDARPVDRDKRVMLVLRTNKFYRGVRDNSRSIPEIDKMDRDMLKAMDIVLHNGKVSTADVPKPAATTLVKRGNLYTAPGGYLQFPSPIHGLVYFMDRHQGQREEIVTTDFKEFLVEAVRRMSPNTLRSSRSKDQTGHLLERHWQMEFYRTATSILPPNNFVSPDLPPHRVADSATEGYLDFYINDQLQWGIELLREGNDMAEHYARFRRGGVYEDILTSLKHWAIIDFRSAQKRIDDIAGDRRTHLLHVSYTDDYETAIFKWWNSKEQFVVKLIGGKIDLP